MPNPMLGVLGGLAAGLVIGLFVPFGPAMLIVVGLLVIALIPQLGMVRVPAVAAVLAAVMTSLIKIYVLSKTGSM